MRGIRGWGCLCMVLLLAAGCASGRGRTAAPSGIPSAGGQYFGQRLCYDVPVHLQRNTTWCNDSLGGSYESIGSAGCTMCCTAMVLSYYGIETDPKALNAYLSSCGGYTPSGLLIWEKCVAYSGGRVRLAYMGAPDYGVIDSHLLRGTPSIAKLYLPGGIPHWVVIVGKEGYEYLARDPLTETGPRPLSQLGRSIHALRVLERVTPPQP